MLKQRLTPGTATATVATDGVATTDPMATMVTMERDLPRLSQPPLPTPMLMLMPGTDTTDTVAMDGVATTGLTATTDTMERDLLRLSQSHLLPLIPMLMLMPGTATMDTDTAATAPTDTGVTGAKPTNREVDSSSDCDFPSTLASISRACA